jgi:transporter family protein
LVTGILGGVGNVTFFESLSRGGKASIVVVTPLIALYPVVTVALAVPLLHERITRREWLGIVLAITATIALSYEKNTQTSGGLEG